MEVDLRGAYDIPVPTPGYDAVGMLVWMCGVAFAVFVEPADRDLHGIPESHYGLVEVIDMLL
jgi:hypothetical protein